MVCIVGFRRRDDHHTVVFHSLQPLWAQDRLGDLLLFSTGLITPKPLHRSLKRFCEICQLQSVLVRHSISTSEPSMQLDLELPADGPHTVGLSYSRLRQSLVTFYIWSVGTKAQCESSFNCALEVLLRTYLLAYYLQPTSFLLLRADPELGSTLVTPETANLFSCLGDFFVRQVTATRTQPSNAAPT